jgi:tRNA G10  N-methylase Trm11
MKSLTMMSMKYRKNVVYNGVMTYPKRLAILGRQPELGTIELESLLGPQNITPFGTNAIFFDGEVDIDRLGGVIKVGSVIYVGPVKALADIELPFTTFAEGSGKTTFGLSYYGMQVTPRFVLAAGLELKKELKAFGPVRMVAPTTGTELTAAQLLHNQVLTEGFELLVVGSGREMVVAVTTGVQDIESYAARDHGRPARDAKVGMLPPKLAQILINTTSAALIVDPFCGTGVVLQEALLSGRAAIGYDLASEMVQASETNLNWLDGRSSVQLPDWAVSAFDARKVVLPTTPLAIVSEGYLGPNMSNAPNQQLLADLDFATSQLYRETLQNWATQLPAATELALCIPNWRTASGWQSPKVLDDLVDLGYTTKVFKHAPRVIRYARPDQIVGRQLLFLTRT